MVWLKVIVYKVRAMIAMCVYGESLVFHISESISKREMEQFVISSPMFVLQFYFTLKLALPYMVILVKIRLMN
jgi:hypothetical protein